MSKILDKIVPWVDFRPGNEYWSGLLDDSDDPAAACCSTIAELHNPYVNPFEHRIKVLQERERSSAR